jgi:hypothetical protein
MRTKLYFIISLIFIGTVAPAASAQTAKPNCRDFRTGTFVYVNPENGHTTFIERDKKIQTEFDDQTQERLTFNLRWIDNCTFILSPTRKSLKVRKDWTSKTQFTLVISETNETGYTQTYIAPDGQTSTKKSIKRIR